MSKVNYLIIDQFKVKDIFNQRIAFDVPLDYSNKDSITIKVVVNITQRYDANIHNSSDTKSKILLPSEPKLIVYLQGGPGFPCDVPLSASGKDKVLLDRGYQIVYLDQRGTGLSTPIEAETFEFLVRKQFNNDYSLDNQLECILNFRADSIVEDLELIRSVLIGSDKWSLLGQSYGGFVSCTYLSKYKNALKEVLITGGIPPIGFEADDVYRATYARTKERNEHYFAKYEGDRNKLKSICQYLSNNKVNLPNGGNLSVERFQQLGIGLGATGGTDRLHEIVTKFHHDLSLFGKPTYQILHTIENASGFDTNVIYALFQEAIYCDGNLNPTNWSADRTRYETGNEEFWKADDGVYFTGEMVYRSMFDDYTELRKFKLLAERLHANTKWSSLYDRSALKNIGWELPIVAATYVADQYVDFDLCRKVKQEVFHPDNLKQYITSEYFHNGLRADPDRVLGALFSLLDNRDVD